MGNGVLQYLLSKQHHDGVAASSGGSVLDRECVIVILDDVKVDVRLRRTHYARGTFNANTDVT